MVDSFQMPNSSGYMVNVCIYVSLSVSSLPMSTWSAAVHRRTSCSRADSLAMTAIRLGSWLSTRTLSRTRTSSPFQVNTSPASSCAGCRLPKIRSRRENPVRDISDAKAVGVCVGVLLSRVRRRRTRAESAMERWNDR